MSGWTVFALCLVSLVTGGFLELAVWKIWPGHPCPHLPCDGRLPSSPTLAPLNGRLEIVAENCRNCCRAVIWVNEVNGYRRWAGVHNTAAKVLRLVQ